MGHRLKHSSWLNQRLSRSGCLLLKKKKQFLPGANIDDQFCKENFI